MKKIEDDLGEQIEEIKNEVNGMMQDVKGLTTRQAQLELHDVSTPAKVLIEYGKNNE